MREREREIKEYNLRYYIIDINIYIYIVLNEKKVCSCDYHVEGVRGERIETQTTSQAETKSAWFNVGRVWTNVPKRPFFSCEIQKRLCNSKVGTDGSWFYKIF